MSPDMQNMEILPNNSRRSGGVQEAPEQMTPEFDAFFEKLSNIDDLTLTDDPAPEEKKGAITRKPVLLRPDSTPKRGTQQGQKRRMQVMRSEFIQSSGKGISWKNSAPRAPRGEGGSITASLLTILKLAVAASLLFGIGLGSGYLALSLPFKPDEGFPLVQNDQVAVEAIVSGESADPNRTDVEPGPDVPAFSEKVKTAGAESGEKIAGMQIDADLKARMAPSVVKPAESSARKVNSVKSKTGRKFAIQVGACNSPACVSAYRRLLLAHVSSDAIQVIESSVGKSQVAVQRIRVVSLSALDANKLKNNLAASDARFKDAYVVTLSNSPSS